MGAKIFTTSKIIDLTILQFVRIGGSIFSNNNFFDTGYKAALADAGIKFEPSRVLKGDYSRSSAREALVKYLKRNVLFDGIFAGNDVMAIEALGVLREKGLRVPSDCKVIGFDGTEQTRNTVPPLSTIAQPSFDLGKKVAAQLMKPSGEELENVTLPLELVVRDSTR